MTRRQNPPPSLDLDSNMGTPAFVGAARPPEQIETVLEMPAEDVLEERLPPQGGEAPVQAGPELSPEEQVMFASLLTCGRRSKTIVVFDHTVVVQTLCGDDDLRIGLFVKDYTASFGEQRAYQIAVAAAGIRSVDGQPFVQGLFDVGDDALFDQKVAKVRQMYPFVINLIYTAVLDAEREFVELANKLGK